MEEKLVRQPRKVAKCYTVYNAPRGKFAAPGKAIYEYEYLDRKTGEVVKRKENTQEKIQSYGGMCDYKKRIAEGTYDGTMDGNYGDVSELQMDAVDAVLLSEFIAGLSQDEISTILEQRNASSVEGNEEQEVVTKTNEEAGEEATPIIPPVNPTDGGTN